MRSIPLVFLALACGGLDGAGRIAGGGSGVGASHRLGGLFYLPGEHFEWEVRWFDVLVGRVQLAVGEEGVLDGRRQVVVRSLAKSDGALAAVREGELELLTWIDVETGAPLAQAGSFDEIYSGEILGTHFGALEWPRAPWTGSLPGGGTAQSSHTALGVLRAWRAEPGARAHFFVRLRHRLLRVDLVASGRERVASPLGRSMALRIDGVLTPVGDDLEPEPGASRYPMAIWIDEGEERVPVRIRIESGFGGTIEMNLVSYDPPGALVSSR